MKLERWVATAAGTACVLMGIVVWRGVSAQQETWPFPAVYFSQLIGLGAAEAAIFVRGLRWRAGYSWAAGGALAAFSILGAWTVGLIFMPMALGFLAAGIISDMRHGGRMGLHALMALLGGAAQAAVMLAMVTWF